MHLCCEFQHVCFGNGSLLSCGIELVDFVLIKRIIGLPGALSFDSFIICTPERAKH